jgi:hypothetical protein
VSFIFPVARFVPRLLDVIAVIAAAFLCLAPVKSITASFVWDILDLNGVGRNRRRLGERQAGRTETQ